LQVLKSLSSISEQFLHTLQLFDATNLFSDIDEKNVRSSMHHAFDFCLSYTKRHPTVADHRFP